MSVRPCGTDEFFVCHGSSIVSQRIIAPKYGSCC
jgi:hypothetical protein